MAIVEGVLLKVQHIVALSPDIGAVYRNALPHVILSQHDRIPITQDNVIIIAAPPLLLYLFQCYLVRRPNTYWIRLALVPILVPWLLFLTFGVQWFPEHTMALNVPFTTTGVLFVLRAAEYGFSPAGRLQLGEKVPGEARFTEDRSLFRKIYDGIYDAIELCLAQRGIGWDFGTGEGLRLPPLQLERPVHNTRAWIRDTIIKDILGNYLVVDVINTWWRTIPTVSSLDPSRPTFRELPIWMQLVMPGTVMRVVCAYMSMWYDVTAVLDVALLGRDPTSWPVLFGEPWKSQSLHHLWAVEWHQLSRRTFLVPLGYPLRCLFGTPGMMFGAFLASGLYHNLMLIGDGLAGLNIPTISFFVLQAFGAILERAFRQVTGRKVGGPLGNIWVIVFLLVTGQWFAELWIDRGYLQISPIPARFSLSETIVQILGGRWRREAGPN